MLLLDSAEVPPQVVYRDHCYVVPRDGTRVVVGSTMEDVGYANAVTEEGMAHLREVAAGLHAPLAHATEAGRWAGMRPASVDGLPILGPGHLAGLVLATAHFRNGIALAPLTAELVTRWLTGRPVATSVDALAPSRFGPAHAV
jgi:glycine oxidase